MAVSAASSGFLDIYVVPSVLLALAVLLSFAYAFRKKQALLTALFEHAPLAITFTRADGQVVRVNAEFTRLFGYGPKEAVGSSLGDLIVPEDRRDELQAHIRSVARGRRVEVETVRRRQDGRLVAVSIVCVPVSVASGQVGIYAMYDDITARKEVEESLRGYPGLLIETQEAERRRPPAILDDLGLIPALLRLFERFTSQTGVRVEFRQSSLGGRRFAAEVETAAYSIVQEALTNVARHAGVDHVTVLTWATSTRLGVEIEDRGVGFDRERQRARSLGLAGMRDRATLLGGRFAVDTSPGAGTLVRADLPLHGDAVR